MDLNGVDHDEIHGSDNNDSDYIEFLYGEAGKDWIFGNADADFLLGGTGEDHLNGGGGNDRMDSEEDNDELRGGGGNDTQCERNVDALGNCIFGGGSNLFMGEDGADKFYIDPDPVCGAPGVVAPSSPGPENSEECGESPLTWQGCENSINMVPTHCPW